MKWLSDQVVARLQAEAQLPDLTGSRYRAVSFLGRGGMGAVWLAEDEILERNVALKILAPENSSPELARRLMREALVLARLEHPGIVPIHDAGTLADGRTFYCMKHVEGRTLDQFAATATLRKRLQLVQRIAEPLAFAHARGIVHRDLKPGNIMIGAFGEVLVMDWGLAKITGDAQQRGEIQQAASSPPKAHHAASATEHGAILGTPGFMAPEQARGEVDAIDQRTDVFGLGAVLNFMLQEPAIESPNKAVPKPLAAIAARATSPEMASRYSSVQDLSADIGRYLEGLSVNAYQESLLERAGRLFARHQSAIVLVLAYLLMRLLFVLFSRR